MLTPRLVSVQLVGDALAGFAPDAPTQHIKLFLPAPGQDEPSLPVLVNDVLTYPNETARPIVRTFTPRRFDPETQALEVQFVLHGEGPASHWAQNAAPGDRTAVGGPGGRFQLDLTANRWWIAGDESAIPAIGTLLEALPAGAIADVHLEVADASDEVPLTSDGHAMITWHRRVGAWGDVLLAAAETARIGPGTQVWVACEASAVRRIRRLLLTERQLPAGCVMTRGYWRLGASNHPDHDYGDGDPSAV